MHAVEIPQENRQLGLCRGCRNKHMCSWNIDGKYLCGDCADEVRGIVKEEPKPELNPDNAPNFKYTLGDKPFTLTPIKTTHAIIGQLNSGWVLNCNGESYTFTSKKKLLEKLNGMIGGKEWLSIFATSVVEGLITARKIV